MRTSAIPKGPTLDPHIWKRLTIPTTNHTLDYRHFEGIREESQEGTGSVKVWGQRIYVPERENGKGVREEVFARTEAEAVMAQKLVSGALKFSLYCTKLQRSFALIRNRGLGKEEGWF